MHLPQPLATCHTKLKRIPLHLVSEHLLTVHAQFPQQHATFVEYRQQCSAAHAHLTARRCVHYLLKNPHSSCQPHLCPASCDLHLTTLNGFRSQPPPTRLLSFPHPTQTPSGGTCSPTRLRVTQARTQPQNLHAYLSPRVYLGFRVSSSGFRVGL